MGINMANFIFLTNQYLPSPGATGLCVHQLAKNLVGVGNNVWVICYETKNMDLIYDGVNILPVKTPFYLENKPNEFKLLKILRRLCSLGCKLFHLNNYPLRSSALVKRYIKTVESILNKMDKVVLVSSYTPLEACIANARLKEKYANKVKSVIYSTDTLSNEMGEDGILSAEYRSTHGYKWEQYLFDRCDLALIMECHKQHYYSDLFKDYYSKFRIVNFPFMEPIKTQNESFDVKNKCPDTMILVYAGTMYRKLRNPEFLLSLLINLSHRIKIKAFFLGGGDCEDILVKAEYESHGAIEYLGMQPHAVAMQYILSADILLSVGNQESPMAPSKIYEYMSTGKPIIHTFTYEKDPCIEPLKRYENALILDQSKGISDKDMDEFISNLSEYEYDSVANKFISSTPDYSTNFLLEL